MLLLSLNLNCLARIHSLFMSRDAPINRCSVISDWLGVSKKADLKGPSDYTMHCVAHSFFLGLLVFGKGTSFDMLTVTGILGHPNWRFCQSGFGFNSTLGCIPAKFDATTKFELLTFA